MRRLLVSSSILVVALAPLALVSACDNASTGWRRPAVATAGSGSSTPPAPSSSAASESPADAAPPQITAPLTAADGGGAPQERIVVKVSYAGDEPATSSFELERGGGYRLERHVEGAAAAKEPGSVCSGTLSNDITGALWRAIDNAAFVPAESGFSKTVSVAGAKAGQSSKYSFLRILTDLSLAPQDENTARSIVNPAKSAISTAEKQASSSGTCTKLPAK